MTRPASAAWSLARAVTVFAAIGCGVGLDPPPDGPADLPATPRAGGVLRLAVPEEPRTLDPALGYDTASWAYELAIFSTLVDYDDGTEIGPSVASSWSISADGRTYDLPLRAAVRFSTGRPLSPIDVRYSLERLLTPALHSQGAEFFAGIAGAEAFAAGAVPHVDGIHVDDPTRVRFTLTAPDPLFLHKLAMPFAAIVDHETVARLGDKDFARAPVGTGPFRVAEWRYGQRLRLERNQHYFRAGRPYLDGIEVTIGVSDQLAWFKYQRGELDVAGIPSAEFNRVLADPRYAALILRRATLRTQYVGVNCGVPPFDQRSVRQALNYAIDSARVLDLADGRGMVARTVLPPDMPGYRRRNARYQYDPEHARSLIAAAGVTGINTTLWTSADDGPLRLAQSIQRDLGGVGIDVRIKPVTFPALIEAIRNPRQVPLFILGWEADFPDPSNFLTVLLHSRNRGTNNNTFFASPRVDHLLDAADATTDGARRLRYFQRAERAVLSDAPWVPLFHPVSFAVRHPRVRDYRLHPLRPSRFEQVWLAG